MIMRQIGIVGSSRVTPDYLERAKKMVVNILEQYHQDDTQIVSGGNTGRKGTYGIDYIAEFIAKDMGYNTLIFHPKTKDWNGYKARNLQIAGTCSKVYSIAMPQLNHKSCYHCRETNNTHSKTAGCWTAHHCSNWELRVL